MRSGDIGINTGSLSGAGKAGYIWPSTTEALTSSIWALSYNLTVLDSSVNPSNGPNVRYYGHPLRRLHEDELVSAGGVHTNDGMDHLMD